MQPTVRRRTALNPELHCSVAQTKTAFLPEYIGTATGNFARNVVRYRKRLWILQLVFFILIARPTSNQNAESATQTSKSCSIAAPEENNGLVLIFACVLYAHLQNAIDAEFSVRALRQVVIDDSKVSCPDPHEVLEQNLMLAAAPASGSKLPEAC
jgi:hypothetical protein